MFCQILDAAAARLRELFVDCPVCTDVTGAEMELPCFLVGFQEPEEKAMPGGRYRRETGIWIRYLPKIKPGKTRDLAALAEQVMDGMEYITMEDGSLVRGTQSKFKITDGELHYFVNYNMTVLKTRLQAEEMEELLSSVGIGKGD